MNGNAVRIRKRKLNKPSKSYYMKLVLLISNTIIIVLIGLFLALGYASKLGNIPDSIFKVCFAIIGSLLTFEKFSFEGIRDVLPWENSLRIELRKKGFSKESPVRISYCAVLIVEVNGKYLLKKNSHGLETFGLPARAYGMSIEKKDELIKNFGVQIDTHIDKDWYDYRLYVKAKYLKKFYNQFVIDVNPYTYDYRPILNQIIEGYGLDENIFKDAKIEFDTRIIPLVKYTRKVGTLEMYVLYRFILKPNEEQFAVLNNILDQKNKDYRFECLEVIKQNGVNKAINKMNSDIPEFVYDTITYRDN